jgi:hypothetical protein
MQPDRETVYQALATLLGGLVTGAPGAFKTVTRRIQPLNAWQPVSSPYLFQVQETEKPTTLKGVPTSRKFALKLVVAANYGESATRVPSTVLNGLLTAIEGILGPNAATAFQQLGVPVSSAVINGTIEIFEGVLGQWTAAIVPVEIQANY